MTSARRAAAHTAPVARQRRAAVALAGHVALMTAWGPLLAGCLTGIGVTAALLVFAGPIETPADLGVGVRASFVPLIAALAFLLQDPARQLTGALPARAWLTPALRTAVALPLLAASAAIQLGISDSALATILRADGQPQAGLPWLALTAELAAWCALALALAAGFERTRWRDLAGLIAAVSSLAVVGVVALLPLHALPVIFTGMSAAQRNQWAIAWRLWTVVAVGALLAARWAVGDPWHRIAVPVGLAMRGRRLRAA